MAIITNDGDRIKLSSLDVRVLVALMEGQMGSYELGQQCQKDTPGVMISHGALYPALKRLEVMHFINKSASTGKNSHVYRITSVGRQVLEWEIDSLKQVTKLYNERTKKSRR